MGLELLGAANALGSFFGNIVNPFVQAKTNKQSRDWQEKMYGVQRRDSLADWQREADYNNPAEQMKRLKAAGLNPNLVYGHGADATMGSVRGTSAGSWNPVAPRVDFTDTTQGLGAIYDMKLKDAQIDNLAVARQVQGQDVLLKAAQTLKTLTDNRSSDFDLKMKNELKEINVQMAEKGLEKLDQDVSSAGIDLFTKSTIQEDVVKKAKAEAEKALNEAGASKHLENRVIQEIENLRKDGDIKQFQVNLSKLGITSSDNVFLRIMTTLFGKFLPK